MKEERFARLNLVQGETTLKIEMINDVPARVGGVENHSVLGRLDSAENILANKVTALLAREEPKDIADVWGFCCLKKLSLHDAITGAQGRLLAFSPPTLQGCCAPSKRRTANQFDRLQAPPLETFISQLTQLGDNLFLSK